MPHISSDATTLRETELAAAKQRRAEAETARDAALAKVTQQAAFYEALLQKERAAAHASLQRLETRYLGLLQQARATQAGH